MKIYILIEIATGRFYKQKEDDLYIYNNKDEIKDEFNKLKNGFLFDNSNEPIDDTYIINTENELHIIAPCEDFCYNDNSEYILKIIEKEL